MPPAPACPTVAPLAAFAEPSAPARRRAGRPSVVGADARAPVGARRARGRVVPRGAFAAGCPRSASRPTCCGPRRRRSSASARLLGWAASALFHAECTICGHDGSFRTERGGKYPPVDVMSDHDDDDAPRPSPARRRAPAGHPAPEAAVAARGRGGLAARVQGVGPRRLRAGRAGHLGAAAAAAGPLLPRARRPAAAAGRGAGSGGRAVLAKGGKMAIDLEKLEAHERFRVRHARPVPPADPGPAAGLQRSGHHDPPRRPEGDRLHPGTSAPSTSARCSTTWGCDTSRPIWARLGP